MLLETRNLWKTFGGVDALAGVSLGITEGEFIGLIGPNGSGKTTLVNCLTVFFRPDRGQILLRGRRIDRFSPYAVARQGIGRTFQICKVFRRLTVLQNLVVPALVAPGRSFADAVRKADDLLALLRLASLRDARGLVLSGGQQKLLELGMLLMLDPQVILLDEPFAGVHPELKQTLHDLLLRLHVEGRTILLVSHDMGSVFQLCTRVLVLNKGRLVADGPPHAVREDPALSAAYLGG